MKDRGDFYSKQSQHRLCPSGLKYPQRLFANPHFSCFGDLRCRSILCALKREAQEGCKGDRWDLGDLALGLTRLRLARVILLTLPLRWVHSEAVKLTPIVCRGQYLGCQR